MNLAFRAVGGLGCALAAVALGVGSSWVHGPAWVFTVTSMQAVWAAGACLAGAVVGGRRWPLGAVAGGSFGLIAIGSYYATQGLVAGARAARWQLAESGGGFWISAAIFGGMLMGANGVVLTRWPTGRLLDPTALAHAVLAGIFACEAMFVLGQLDRFVLWGGLREVCVGMLLLSLLLCARTLTRSGLRATVVAFAIAMTAAPIAAELFLHLEHTYGYVTV